jgi:lysophospholipase L1-like esterase
MAAHGGHTTRWAVALSALGATALLATSAAVAPPAEPGVAPAAAGALAAGTSTSPSGSSAAASSSAAPTSGVVPGASNPSGTSTASGSGSSSAIGTESAAGTATTAAAPGTGSPGAPSASASGSIDAGQPVATPAIVTRSVPLPPQQIAGVPYVPAVAFIGDSWTAGVGATGDRSYAVLTGEQLGWENNVLGVGGSGYVRGGSGNVPFRERIEAAVRGNPDVVVIQGSINERNTPVEQLAPAVAETLTLLRQAAGRDTDVVVLGASYVPGLTRALVDRVNDTVRAEAARQGLRFVDVAAENWTDPADPSIWADRYHPDDRGYQLIADRLVPLLRSVVEG